MTYPGLKLYSNQSDIKTHFLGLPLLLLIFFFQRFYGFKTKKTLKPIYIYIYIYTLIHICIYILHKTLKGKCGNVLPLHIFDLLLYFNGIGFLHTICFSF